MNNENDRRAPIFIENEGARLASEWAPSAKGCTLAATCVPSPFLIGFGVGHEPNPRPKPPGLSPRPCPKTQLPMASWPNLTARH
ncbi:hypothetical protein IGI04_008759 [Brassica rapa subsp. trilocularis]|uniref:Uncharacterized protein n=1 Tax=Brassica rapa subsp. trilocularis TaxID=1813537 RepID=A0ABQ7MXV9_BRACM|nr:hypothetical protein IGI04_008759 [Brassica rapa subsp. trilocularis]